MIKPNPPVIFKNVADGEKSPCKIIRGSESEKIKENAQNAKQPRPNKIRDRIGFRILLGNFLKQTKEKSKPPKNNRELWNHTNRFPSSNME